MPASTSLRRMAGFRLDGPMVQTMRVRRVISAIFHSALASPLSSPAARRQRLSSKINSALASPLSSPAARRQRLSSKINSALASELRSSARTPTQGLLEDLAGEGLAGLAANVLGRADGDHPATVVSSLGPEIDDPVGRLDHVDVVLDDEHGIALLHELVEDLQE